MQVSGIMITNGGPHPADRWSATTAAQICDLIQVDEASTSPEAVRARKAKPRFELDLADALEKHHGDVQSTERDACEEHGADRYGHHLHPGDDAIDEAILAVQEAAIGTPFEDHFGKPEVHDALREIIGSHMATAMEIERKWHSDRNR